MITLDSLDLHKITPEELGELLIDAKKAYYTGGKPIMDDHTYDTLEDLLHQKNPYHRIFTKVGTPNFDTGWTKKKHFHSMSSQNKVTTYEDLTHYFELKKIPNNTRFVVQPKCDGLSLELIYQNGQITDAITRGDGQTGDCITQNVVRMRNFPKELTSNFSGSVRCEIIVTLKDFEKLNQLVKKDTPALSREGDGEGFYSNTRNAASGISQRLDSKYSEYCSLYAVDILPEPETENRKNALLKKLGFTPVENHLCRHLSQVEAIYQQYLSKRSQYPFDIDGIVVKIDDHQLAQTLGSQNNRPKYQVAYKFPASTNQTPLLSIDWQTGPMGNITPVAKITPVEISGAIINYVSLANYSLITNLNLNIGDIVEVSRRGDVIPHIDKVITKVKPGVISPPKLCPSCHSPLITDHKFLKCPNKFGCPAQTLGILKLFCQTLDIKNISDKTIEKLVTANKVKLPGDFYDLTTADFTCLEGLGQKSGSNIINEIQAKRTLSVVEVFDSANIPNFSSKRIRQVIATGIDTPQKIQNLTISDLIKIPGFKTTLATKIVDGLTQRRQIINSILKRVTIKNLRNHGKLQGLSFVITGELSLPRKDIEKRIEDNGGQVLTSVSQKTTYLLTNSPSQSSKYLAAKKLGVKIINESDFQKLL